MKFEAPNLEWHPITFTIVMADLLDDKGLLFVYVDDEVDDEEITEFPLDQFFSKLKDVNSFLSSLICDDDSAARLRETCGY
jgi:hypothetical protein